MSNVSLYRKYRPNTFDDVVGQDNIVTILQNAIKQDKVSHAYLFNGPRGTGKTSIAKIFAKKVSCICDDNTCEFCTNDDQKNESTDIWEIDAASNNGVEEVRKIIENVAYMPIHMKYKVYIIDEVHMLTKGAFNALLKTLEEPPAHVIFILATTEIHKIPLTIISRCQRFDFKRINEEKLVQRIKDVLTHEKIEYEISALDKLAKLADGGMRDALSLVDKVAIYGPSITLENVNKSLQLVTEDSKEKLLNLIIAKQIEDVIEYFKEILSFGIDENKFIVDMQYYIRDLMLRTIREDDLEYNTQDLLVYLKMFSELDTKLMFTKNYALVIEVFLIEMCTINPQSDIIYTQKVENTIDVNDHLEKLKEQGLMLKNETTIDFSKEDLKNNNILEEFAENVVEVEFEKKVISDNKVTQEIIFEKSDFMTEKQVIKSQEEINVPDKKEDIEPLTFNDGFDLTNLHEEINEDNQEVEIAVAPAFTIQAADKINEKVNNQISILDVLKSASHAHKDEFINNIDSFKNMLVQKRQFGLAKFFEYVIVTAVGKEGIVFTIDNTLYETYLKRLEELESIIYNDDQKIGKIFLIEINEWNKTRPMYVQALKAPHENTIFSLAQETFKDVIINKI